MPRGQASAASSNPYGEDTSIVLPEGCIAEDVEIDFGRPYEAAPVDQQQQPQQAQQPRQLTYGLENGPMAVLSGGGTTANGGGSVEQPSSPMSNSNFSSSPLSADASKHSSSDSWSARMCGWMPCCPSGGKPAPDIEEKWGRKFTLGERLADKVSGAVGSWYFVCTQTACLLFWILFNANSDSAPDPYPFILLNLLLSFQAAYTGPIVMMSQNRQSDIDRDKAFDLHEKVDHIRLNQVWALWDSLNLQQKKLDTIEEGMERILIIVQATQQAQQQQQQQAQAQQQQQPLSAQPVSPPTAADSAAAAGGGASSTVTSPVTTTAAASATEGTTSTADQQPQLSQPQQQAQRLSTFTSAPSIPATAPGPCECLPPNMCENCMSALERAEVTPAFLRKANPSWIPAAPSSFPTAELVRHHGDYHSRPLEYRPSQRGSPGPSRRELAAMGGAHGARGSSSAAVRGNASPERHTQQQHFAHAHYRVASTSPERVPPAASAAAVFSPPAQFAAPVGQPFSAPSSLVVAPAPAHSSVSPLTLPPSSGADNVSRRNDAMGRASRDASPNAHPSAPVAAPAAGSGGAGSTQASGAIELQPSATQLPHAQLYDDDPAPTKADDGGDGNAS